jgi:hypothetical protein
MKWTDTRSKAFATVWCGLVGNLLGTLWQWPSAGRIERNGFQMASALADLGARLDDPALRVVAALWYLVPLVSAVAVIAVGARHAVVWMLSAVTGVVGLGVCGLTVWAAQRAGLFGDVGGVIVSSLGCLLVAGGSIIEARRAIRVQRTITDS